MKNGFKAKGLFVLEHIRKGEIIHKDEFHNDVVNQGLTSILNTMFGATAKAASWHIGLISNASYSALANTDTMASHAGWTEFVGYSEVTRPAWAPEDATAQTIGNTTAREFSINATGTVKGIFVASDSGKSGTDGVLWSTALFGSGDQNVISGDTIRIKYNVVSARA